MIIGGYTIKELNPVPWYSVVLHTKCNLYTKQVLTESNWSLLMHRYIDNVLYDYDGSKQIYLNGWSTSNAGLLSTRYKVDWFIRYCIE